MRKIVMVKIVMRTEISADSPDSSGEESGKKDPALLLPPAEQEIQGCIKHEQSQRKEEQADPQGQPSHLPDPQGFLAMRAEKRLDLISSVAGKKTAGFIKAVQWHLFRAGLEYDSVIDQFLCSAGPAYLGDLLAHIGIFKVNKRCFLDRYQADCPFFQAAVDLIRLHVSTGQDRDRIDVEEHRGENCCKEAEKRQSVYFKGL